MVRNLGVKETRCPPCRSDFSELQLCHAKSNEQRFATSNNSACSRSSRLRLWRQLLRCNIFLSFSLSSKKFSSSPFSASFSAVFLETSHNGSKNTSPHQIHAPQRRNAPLGGAWPKFRVSFFQGELENPFERLSPFEDRSAAVLKREKGVDRRCLAVFNRPKRGREGENGEGEVAQRALFLLQRRKTSLPPHFSFLKILCHLFSRLAIFPSLVSRHEIRGKERKVKKV